MSKRLLCARFDFSIPMWSDLFGLIFEWVTLNKLVELRLVCKNFVDVIKHKTVHRGKLSTYTIENDFYSGNIFSSYRFSKIGLWCHNFIIMKDFFLNVHKQSCILSELKFGDFSANNSKLSKTLRKMNQNKFPVLRKLCVIFRGGFKKINPDFNELGTFIKNTTSIKSIKLWNVTKNMAKILFEGCEERRFDRIFFRGFNGTYYPGLNVKNLIFQFSTRKNWDAGKNVCARAMIKELSSNILLNCDRLTLIFSMYTSRHRSWPNLKDLSILPILKHQKSLKSLKVSCVSLDRNCTGVWTELTKFSSFGLGNIRFPCEDHKLYFLPLMSDVYWDPMNHLLGAGKVTGPIIINYSNRTINIAHELDILKSMFERLGKFLQHKIVIIIRIRSNNQVIFQSAIDEWRRKTNPPMLHICCLLRK